MCYIIHYRDLVFMVNALCSACTLVIVSYTCITWLVSWSSRIQQETGFSESLSYKGKMFATSIEKFWKKFFIFSDGWCFSH